MDVRPQTDVAGGGVSVSVELKVCGAGASGEEEMQCGGDEEEADRADPVSDAAGPVFLREEAGENDEGFGGAADFAVDVEDFVGEVVEEVADGGGMAVVRGLAAMGTVWAMQIGSAVCAIATVGAGGNARDDRRNEGSDMRSVGQNINPGIEFTGWSGAAGDCAAIAVAFELVEASPVLG